MNQPLGLTIGIGGFLTACITFIWIIKIELKNGNQENKKQN